MFFYEGQKCPVCGNYFGEQDDIVTCPECGAPHHRNCWKTEGHCHFVDLHGTGKEWHEQQRAESEVKTAPKKRCSRCGYDNPEFSEFCARCGLDLDAPEWHIQSAPPPISDRPPVGQYTPPSSSYTPFGFVAQPQDPYGGVPRNETIDGVPVDIIAQLIGPNSAYYLPRFYRMTHGGSKISWNWSALLFSYNWLLYRKQLLWGIVSFVFTAILDFSGQAIMTMLNISTMESIIVAAQNTGGNFLWSVLSLFSLFLVAIPVLIGMFGNYLYLRTILRKAKKLNGHPLSPYDNSFRKMGGVSFALAISPNLLMLVISYINFILSLI